MAELNDPLSILGCYKSTAFKGDLITIDPNEIRLNEDVIYSRYEYGTTRGGQSPYVYADPRGYLWNDDGKLSFSIHDPSGAATLMPELIEGRKVFRLPVFPTADVSDFGADIRLVAFTKSFCPSDTTPNSL